MNNQPPRGPRDRDPIVSAVQELERALAGSSAGQEADWAALLDGALVEVKRAVMQREAELDRRGGQLVDLASDIASSPTGAHMANELRHELDAVLVEVSCLRTHARGAVPDLRSFRERTARLLDALQTFVKQECEMIQEVVNRDTGGEG